MKFNFILLLVVLFQSFCVFGQDDSKNEDYFDDGGINKNANFIKINPLLLVYGEAPIYYERLIFKNVSVELGLGPTLFNKTTFGIATSRIIDKDKGEDEYIENIKGSTGYTFKAGVRAYLFGEFPDNAYIAPEFRYIVYNYTDNGIDAAGNPTSENIDLKTTFTDFALVLGYNYAIYKRLYVDLYAGAATRKYKLDYIDKGKIPYTNEFYSRKATKTEGAANYNYLTAGAKIGILF